MHKNKNRTAPQHKPYEPDRRYVSGSPATQTITCSTLRNLITLLYRNGTWIYLVSVCIINDNRSKKRCSTHKAVRVTSYDRWLKNLPLQITMAESKRPSTPHRSNGTRTSNRLPAGGLLRIVPAEMPQHKKSLKV